MMKEMDLYKLWKEKATEDPDLVKELIEIEDKPVEIKNRFYADLEFGTAGLSSISINSFTKSGSSVAFSFHNL